MELGPAGDHVSLLQNDTLGWDDLVAPPEVHEALRELAGDVALARHAVPALLSGPAGVGKTLAARVVTAVLRLDLFEVRVGGFAADADRVVPPILAAAEAHHFSLLFTDAELLKGAALDSALVRAPTLKAMVLFETRVPDGVDPVLRRAARPVELEPPGLDDRRALWERELARFEPRADVDVDELAELPLTGGRIAAAARNAAANAHLLGQPLTYALIAAQLARRD